MLVPNRLLFRFELPLFYRESPEIDGRLDDWSDRHRLADLCRIDGQEPFGCIWMGWNRRGLFIACRVRGRTTPFVCNPAEFWKGDNLRLCTDMRDTRDIRRASRYCQQFYFLPAGGGRDGRSAAAGDTRIHRATEHAPPAPPGSVRAASRREGDVYTLEAHVSSEALCGFDPDEHRRIGLCVVLEDVQLGRQFLTVGDEFNWHIDPATWATAVLTGEPGTGTLPTDEPRP